MHTLLCFFINIHTPLLVVWPIVLCVSEKQP
jgi:hypothetical protein